MTQPAIDLAFVDEAVGRHGRSPDAALPILQALQEHYLYLPDEALRRVCELTAIRPAQLTGVATFYDYFRHRPAGRHRVRVCHGTACHVAGAPALQTAFESALNLKPGEDTDASGEFTVEKVACVGCCTLAPVIVADGQTLGHLKPADVPKLIEHLRHPVVVPPRRVVSMPSGAPVLELRIGAGSCCQANGGEALRAALEDAVAASGTPALIRSVGCHGLCHLTPLLEVTPAATVPAHSGLSGNAVDSSAAVYQHVDAAGAALIAARHLRGTRLTGRLRNGVERALDRALGLPDPESTHALPPQSVAPALARQVRLATEHCGSLDPLDLDAYLARGGFAGLRRAVEIGPEQAIAELDAAGLRGRGGAGFPTAAKWRHARAAPGERRFVICNGDEGDPGAFMDRMLLESYPYRVIEGLATSAYCTGAREALFYIRAEYPLAVTRIRAALTQAESRGLLGPATFPGGLALSMTVREGAGAFVCGEETALIASIEGRRGEPRLRPPYPVERGLYDCPTCVNNVETLALVPWILRHGGAAFARLGTAGSKGTKVFALTGKVRRGGLVEVPMGVTLRQIVEEIGGGVTDGRRFKAVQIGGPSGGCIPASLCDTPVDFEALRAAGAMMGSGGLVVLDDRDCMVDIARYFLRFTQAQSCGQCSFCRVGTRRLLEILERICEGRGRAGDLERLEALARDVQGGSLCGLGQTAPNPVLTTLRYFRDELEAHLAGRCPAGRCAKLVHYSVNTRCIGCTRCAQACPAGAIVPRPCERQQIDDARCTRCDACRAVCPSLAIEVN